MATEQQNALVAVQELQKKTVADEYGKQSNQFVTEMKSSTLFQFNWGELLSAAPTALSLMGSCWIAAAAPAADKISMKSSVPLGGFKTLTNRKDPTLRSCLVDGKLQDPKTKFQPTDHLKSAILEDGTHSILPERTWMRCNCEAVVSVLRGQDHLAT